VKALLGKDLRKRGDPHHW